MEVGRDIYLREIEREIPAEAGRLSHNKADIQSQWRMWVRHVDYCKAVLFYLKSQSNL